MMGEGCSILRRTVILSLRMTPGLRRARNKRSRHGNSAGDLPYVHPRPSHDLFLTLPSPLMPRTLRSAVPIIPLLLAAGCAGHREPAAPGPEIEARIRRVENGLLTYNVV